ncbi:MAG: GMP reductase [Porticoccaceae bacterium]|nr:GMP reductase [Porticoccaceae bacterium]
MRVVDEVKLDFSDVLIKPKRSELESRKDVGLTRDFRFKHSNHKWTGIPIIASNMDHTGTYKMHKVFCEYGMLVALCKFVEYTDKTNLIQTIGLDHDLDTIDYDSKWLCLDIANGYTERFSTYVKKIRKHEATRDKILIAGNVCTPEATEQIILAGADIVKIGIGPGSVCTTRKMTGVGYPQLSATIECADAAHGLGGHIITDGGCTVVGDLAKSFGAGADFVMLGGMLAGHDECEGEKVGNHRGAKMKFYGMSSDDAQLKYYGEKKSHRASEGKTVYVDYRGPVRDTIQEILGGLSSACTYAGARTIKDLPKTTTFVRVNNQLNTVFS